jgi:hypothetical protein
MEIKNRKIVASFELVLMMLSIFAFSYIVYSSDEAFGKLDKEYRELSQEKEGLFNIFGEWLFERLKSPMIPLASAEGSDLGCCASSNSGEQCMTTSSDDCAGDFATGALCADTSFCRKGCCYDENAGIFDKNTRETTCSLGWVADPNCNMPGARLGCCILGEVGIFETQGQCEVDSISRALGGEGVVDWRADMNELSCAILAANQEEGACVLGNGLCTFGNEVDCLNEGGEFAPGYLCTTESLGTRCEITTQTTCVEGLDQVFFVDSCGNRANVYDSARAEDQDYWEEVTNGEDVCGFGNIDGNADSEDCGNCARTLGGMCASAPADNFDVGMGDFYCKDTTCKFEGVDYKSGESWCVYDGKIGDGDDVVGSRHWKYVCNQGAVQVEPCADYRNQICVQQNTFSNGEEEINFRNSACVANNWRECVSLNSEEGGKEKCEETLNCRLEKVRIADKFAFDVCTPKYPGGFAFKDERYQATAKEICGIATQTCTVIYKQTIWGGCEVVVNEDCLEEGFGQGMNDLCRKLGDCGGEVNIAGKFTKNYQIAESPDLSAGWIATLVALSEPVEGQFAEVEDYGEELAAAGLFGGPGPPPEEVEATDYTPYKLGAAAGLAGLSLGIASIGSGSLASGLAFFGSAFHGGAAGAANAAGASEAAVAAGNFASGSAGLAGLATGIMGAAIGMVIGVILGKLLGLSPIGSTLMGVGAGLVVSYILKNLIFGAANIAFLIAGVILIIISLFLLAADCDPVEVIFECKPWQPPVGADDCEECNMDPLKPCSEYRCGSLGAACGIINKGSDHELCVDSSANDSTPPEINVQTGAASPGTLYDEVSEDGFKITSTDGGCIEAYTPLSINIETNEPAICKFDTSTKAFDDMLFDLGGNYYAYNHSVAFPLPDPSHGQSQGSDWEGDLTLYAKCQDTKGHESPGFYNIDTCVIEGPDRTAPVIRSISPSNDAIVGFEKTSEEVTVITNELSTCKWDTIDTAYVLMTNSMTCDDTLRSPSHPQGYTCKGNVSLDNAENEYFIKCMDQPWLEEDAQNDRNSNQESTLYVLRKPEKKIEIDWVEPSQDFESFTELTTIDLQIKTSGGGEWHKCSYSFSGYDSMIEMFETGGETTHGQPLNRPAGRQKIYVECRDETGEIARSETDFKIIYDTSAPMIARLWREGGSLHFITSEDAECRYSTTLCKFGWSTGEPAGSGEEHSISVIPGKTYYIKCKDDFGNPKSSSGCSREVLMS